MHTINVPLARQVLAQIHAAPDRWTQDQWLDRPYPVEAQAPTDTVNDCQTTGCFAGWTVVLSGHKTNAIGDVSPSAALLERVRVAGYGDQQRRMHLTPRVVAAAELGLDTEQADALFGAYNTLRELYGWLSEWTDGEIAVPDDLPEWADLGPEGLAWHFDPDREEGPDVIAEA